MLVAHDSVSVSPCSIRQPPEIGVAEDVEAPDIRATGLVSSRTEMLLCTRSNPREPETVSVTVFSPGVDQEDVA